MPAGDDEPVLDANGDPVPLPETFADEVLRAWFANRVPAKECSHYLAVSEARAGYTKCERYG